MALAVGFAMVASYILSSTFVPVMSVWVLRHFHPDASASQSRFSFERLRSVFAKVLGALMPWRWPLVGAYVLVGCLALWFVGGGLGREIFPSVDTGQFQLRLRAQDGTRIERTEELAKEALEIIKDKVGPENIAISIGYVGLIGSSYPINTIYHWSRGPEEATLRIALKSASGIRVEALKHDLREDLPRRLGEWLRERMRKEGLPESLIAQRIENLRFSFEPADIVNEVMSFGAPTPIEIAVSGPKFTDSRLYAASLRRELNSISPLRDLQIVQPLEYPAIAVDIDRQRAGVSGVTVTDVARPLVSATSSSRFTTPIFWADPNTGIGYQVQVQIPPYQMNSAEQLGLVPIQAGNQKQLLVRDVATIKARNVVGEYDRYDTRRMVSMTANIEGEDLGRVAERIARAIQVVNESLWVAYQDTHGQDGWKNTVSGEFQEGKVRPGAVPRGLKVDVRGQVAPMRQMFGGLAGGSAYEGLTVGLAMAVLVIFLLLTGYFQSIRLALISVSAIPAVLAGVAVLLALTHTTLNIQSFMGAIMAIGVAVANAILLVTFAERDRLAGRPAPEAAMEGARSRLRPILMTACAMLAGMVPMALGIGEGGEQVAPLGRAVIGGLGAATFATLLVLPAVFAIVQGKKNTLSASLDPDDQNSRYRDLTH